MTTVGTMNSDNTCSRGRIEQWRLLDINRQDNFALHCSWAKVPIRIQLINDEGLARVLIIGKHKLLPTVSEGSDHRHTRTCCHLLKLTGPNTLVELVNRIVVRMRLYPLLRPSEHTNAGELDNKLPT